MHNTHWNPGGWAAKRKGCACPRLENRDGEGSTIFNPPYGPHQYIEHEIDFDRSFIVNLDCPLHADLARYSPTRGSNGS